MEGLFIFWLCLAVLGLSVTLYISRRERNERVENLENRLKSNHNYLSRQIELKEQELRGYETMYSDLVKSKQELREENNNLRQAISDAGFIFKETKKFQLEKKTDFSSVTTTFAPMFTGGTAIYKYDFDCDKKKNKSNKKK